MKFEDTHDANTKVDSIKVCISSEHAVNLIERAVQAQIIDEATSRTKKEAISCTPTHLNLHISALGLV